MRSSPQLPAKENTMCRNAHTHACTHNRIVLLAILNRILRSFASITIHSEPAENILSLVRSLSTKMTLNCSCAVAVLKKPRHYGRKLTRSSVRHVSQNCKASLLAGPRNRASTHACVNKINGVRRVARDYNALPWNVERRKHLRYSHRRNCQRAITASTSRTSYRMNATRPTWPAARDLRNLTQSADPRTRDKSTVPFYHPGYRATDSNEARSNENGSALAWILTRVLSYHVRMLRILLTH